MKTTVEIPDSIYRQVKARAAMQGQTTDRTTADWYATIRHELKRTGTPIPENDIWIGALARQHALKIASNDTHLDHVDKIRRIGW